MGEFTALRADVGDPDAAELIARAVDARWGSVDILVNNAAIMDWRHDFEAEAPELLEETLQINLLGPHRIIRALIPFLRKGRDPRIINVSSEAGTLASLRYNAEGSSYKLSKYALNGLTVLYAGTLRGTVAVNSLDPGWVRQTWADHRRQEIWRKPANFCSAC